jgi:hypothetical protein
MQVNIFKIIVYRNKITYYIRELTVYWRGQQLPKSLLQNLIDEWRKCQISVDECSYSNVNTTLGSSFPFEETEYPESRAGIRGGPGRQLPGREANL